MKMKTFSILTLAVLLLSFMAAIPMKSASAFDTKLAARPIDDLLGTDIHKWSDVDHPGDTFEISVRAEDVVGLFGWEFVLTWTPGMINCTLEELNFNIWGAGNFLGPWVSPSIDNVAGTYHQSLTGKAPGTPKDGTFWLANLTFVIIQEPGYGEVLHTELHLQKAAGFVAYCLLDSGSNEIPHDYIHGNYYYHWAPPTEYAYLEVDPEDNIFAGKNIYKTPFTFSVDINVRDVDPGWRLSGIEFLLFYNTSVLDILSVTEGTFFEPFCVAEFFFFEDFPTEGKLRVAYAMLGPGAAAFGDGLICTIEFNATLQHQFPDIVWSDLDLQVDVENGMGSYFVNFLADEIPYDPEVDGYYELAGYVIGRVIDVYTQYPDPFGGQGPAQPSDMFWPQKEVHLFALVTYNEWPVQQKPVSFEVRAPDGTIMTILTGVTNETGVAHVSFRMNWPCENPEDLFGVWTVVATVDIACIVVNDTLQFHYDYLVHFTKVTTEFPEYGHCAYMNIIVEFTSHAQQEYWVIIAVTLHDELNYPVITGTVYANVTIGGAVFCTPEEYDADFTIHVDKSVAAGTAIIHVSALTNFPFDLGTALCPEITTEVNILATWA
ncbi:hypothetical protein HXY33_03465 [Candidatus Bathyarchaeota archaeon]|nr:hypothetical protein [Candidatus Bathyarchaeota archaeon]